MPIFEKTPDPPPRIHAIASVHIEAGRGLEDKLRWFYADLLGLESGVAEPGALHFQTGRRQLCIALGARPRSSPLRRRLVLEIPSLDQMRERLEELRIPYEWYEGLGLTDKRIYLLDPARNRIELKQVWAL